MNPDVTEKQDGSQASPPVNGSEAAEETYEHNFLRCPHCQHADYDAWEMGRVGEDDSGQTKCGHCEATFKWERATSVTYRGIPLPPNESSSATCDEKSKA